MTTETGHAERIVMSKNQQDDCRKIEKHSQCSWLKQVSQDCLYVSVCGRKGWLLSIPVQFKKKTAYLLKHRYVLYRCLLQTD